MNIRLKILSWVFIFLALSSAAQPLLKVDEALGESDRPILLIFSGSDWCAPCIRLEREVLAKKKFEDFAQDNLVVLKADFPQRNRLPQDVQKQNEALAEKFNPNGLFPHLVLLKPDRSILATLVYRNQSPDQFIDEISLQIKKMNAVQELKEQARLMGSAFEFVVVAEEDFGKEHIDASINEVKRIEALLTEFSQTSQTAYINGAAGVEPVKVELEVYEIIKRAKAISTLTQGAFDITAGALKKLYNFKGEAFTLPDSNAIKETLKLVGYERIKLLDSNRVYLEKPGMHIGFAAIGKGYAADKVKAMLIQRGVKSGVINASGDLTAWGTRNDGSPWKVGIADPDNRDSILMWIPIENSSVATSGDYEQYFERNGIRYSHTIDPKTGMPVAGIKSVTVISPSAELSDALATAVFVMGVDVGMNFIEQLPQTHCIIINDKNKVSISKNLKINSNP